MGMFVIAVYRPKPGHEIDLRNVLADHLPILRNQGYATDFPPLLLRANDGAYLEIFEWKSSQAVDDAHQDPVIHELWARFEKTCEYGSLADLAQANDMFPHFAQVTLTANPA